MKLLAAQTLRPHPGAKSQRLQLSYPRVCMLEPGQLVKWRLGHPACAERGEKSEAAGWDCGGMNSASSLLLCD